MEKGQKHTKKSREKMSQSLMGRKVWNKGIKYTEEKKKNLNLEGLEFGHGWNRGTKGIMKAWNKGKKFPQFSGENHPNWGKKGILSPHWKGGISSLNSRIRISFEMRQWRESVFKRDDYRCMDCGIKSGEGKRVILNADHILQFSKYPRLRFVLENGQTLCKPCHKQKTRFERTGRMELNSPIYA